MSEYFTYPSEMTGAKSIAGAIVFLVIGIPIVIIGAFLIWSMCTINKPFSGDSFFLIIFGFVFVFGGFGCLSRSLAYATGRAKLFLPNEGRKGPVITSIVVTAPMLHLVNHLEKANSYWLLKHTWIAPAALLLIAAIPFFVWWWFYRWKQQ